MPKYDWKDGLLVGVGFVACIMVLSTIKSQLGLELGRGMIASIAVASILGMPLLRRRLFGTPQLPEPKKGVLASLISIFGLLGTIFGVALLVIFVPRLFERGEGPPDYGAEQHGVGEQLDFEIRSGEVNDEEAAMIQAAELAKYQQEEQEEAAARLAEWEQDIEESRAKDRLLTLIALGLLGLGALASKWRYAGKLPVPAQSPNQAKQQEQSEDAHQ